MSGKDGGGGFFLIFSVLTQIRGGGEKRRGGGGGGGGRWGLLDWLSGSTMSGKDARRRNTLTRSPCQGPGEPPRSVSVPSTAPKSQNPVSSESPK